MVEVLVDRSLSKAATNKLTDPAIRNVKSKTAPFRLSDGGGMFIEVRPAGGKWWRLAYRFDGKQKLLAPGTYPDASLTEACQRRRRSSRLQSDQGDLLAMRLPSQDPSTNRPCHDGRPAPAGAPSAAPGRSALSPAGRVVGAVIARSLTFVAFPLRAVMTCLAIVWLNVAFFEELRAQQTDSDDRLPVQVTVGGAPSGGAGAAIVEGLAELVRREYPGSAFNYEPGSLAGALVRLTKGEVAFAVTGPSEIEAAVHGKPPFQRSYPRDTFPVVARVADHLLAYVIARADFLDRHRIVTLDDIATLRVPVRISVGQPGNVMAELLVRGLLSTHGIAVEDIERWGGASFGYAVGTSVEMLKDNKVDMMISAGFHPDARLLELSRGTPVRLLAIAPDKIDRVAADAGIETGFLPKGLYNFVTSDTYTTSSGLYLVAGPTTDPAVVYKVVKAFHRHFDWLRTMHPAFQSLSVQDLVKAGSQPLHPAAARYFREVQLIAE